MAETQPLFEDALCYTGTDLRTMLASLVCGEGVGNVFAGDLLVTTGVSGLNLSVAQGRAFIDSDVADEGMYAVYNDAPETVTATTAHATLPRIDQVIATVNDSQLSGLADDWVLSVLPGTATSGATLANLTGAAALPDRSIRLAYVLVPAAFAGPFVNATHILDARNNYTYCGNPVLRVYRTAAINAPTGAAAAIPFDTLDLNSFLGSVGAGGVRMYDTNTGIFTAPQDGLYRISWAVGINPNAADWLAIEPFRNGTIMANIFAHFSSGAGGSNVGSFVFNATAGMTVELRAVANAARALAVGSINTWMTIEKL